MRYGLLLAALVAALVAATSALAGNGNGAVITYATVWQSYDQAGWYTLTNAYGPWWSGGCAGCANVRASGYILWNWKAALVNVSHSGTTSLDTTMWAYGGVSF